MRSSVISLIISIILKWCEHILKYLGQLQYNMDVFIISTVDKVTSIIDFIVFCAYIWFKPTTIYSTALLPLIFLFLVLSPLLLWSPRFTDFELCFLILFIHPWVMLTAISCSSGACYINCSCPQTTPLLQNRPPGHQSTETRIDEY